MAKAKPPETVTITYDLFDLPTAQHKAGLAGLLLQIESMKSRKQVAPTYRWDTEASNSRVHIEFTEESTGSLFNDLYDATWIEGAPREKPNFKGKGDSKKEIPAIRRVAIAKTDKKGVEKTIEGYVYPELTPSLATLRQYLPPQSEWVRLWRDLIWQVIRDSKKKAPYILRAAEKAMPKGASLTDDSETEDADDESDEKGKADGSTWADLVKHHQAIGKNKFATGKLSSALLLGAQRFNAETVAFAGRVNQNLLLHFWPMTCMVYVPRFVDGDGNSHIGRRDKKDKTKHFCLAIPDVADLRGFVENYPRLLAGLDPETAVYRPKESLIDMAAEGGISFIEHLARLAPQIAGNVETRGNVSGIDYMHLNQDGNIVRLVSTGRAAYSKHLAEDYLNIVGRAGQKPPYSNPLFRRGLMLALLDNKPWFQPFGKLFAAWDVSFFVPTAKPSNLSRFWLDARKKLKEFIMSANSDLPPVPITDELLAMLIEQIVRRFLLIKCKKERGINPKVKMSEITPEKRREVYAEKPKLAQDTFYKARSRNDRDFILFFTEEICSGGAHIDRKSGLYSQFAAVLMDRTRVDDVKCLTLLALSANA